jgi:hypothetical protein
MADRGKINSGYAARFFAWVVLGILIITSFVYADSKAESFEGNVVPWYQKFNTEWGGHVKSTGTSSWHDHQTIYRIDEDNPFFDTSLDFRLKNRIDFSDLFFVNTHYEAIANSGDTLKKENQFQRQLSNITNLEIMDKGVNDDRRLLNLTSTIHNEDNYYLYHRLDRFQLTLQPAWGAISIGRQALTWGNGLLFNPMDLFNPFSPTDIDRDYKMGDDMVAAAISTQKFGDIEFLAVPRRDLITGEIEGDESSIAVKHQFTRESNDFHIMLARHYGESVAGIGSTGYLFDAVWRTDIVWSSLQDSAEGDNGYFSVVANMDYSWVWWGKNFYGLVEYYFNELGTDRYSEIFFDPEIMSRLERGELFVLGRSYLSGQINVELHPLVSLYITNITNLQDPSGTLQAWLGWNIFQNTQVTFGGNCFYGTNDTEFGGYTIESTAYIHKPSPNLFLWVTAYF